MAVELSDYEKLQVWKGRDILAAVELKKRLNLTIQVAVEEVKAFAKAWYSAQPRQVNDEERQQIREGLVIKAIVSVKNRLRLTVEEARDIVNGERAKMVTAAPVPLELCEAEMELARCGHRIEAIRMLRKRLGLEFEPARQLVADFETSILPRA